MPGLFIPTRLRRSAVPPRRQRRDRGPLPALRARRGSPHGHPARAVRRRVPVAEHARRRGGEGRRHHRSAHEQPPPLRALRHGPRPPGAVGGRRNGAAAGRALGGRPRRLLRQGRARQHPRWCALCATRRSALDLPGQPGHEPTAHRASSRSATTSRSTRSSCAALYGDQAGYVERFEPRLDELVAEGWLLAEDADEMRREAEAGRASDRTSTTCSGG